MSVESMPDAGATKAVADTGTGLIVKTKDGTMKVDAEFLKDEAASVKDTVSVK